MDVAMGPCVPLPGRKHALRSVHQQQGPERVEQMLWLYVVLGGAPQRRHTALELLQNSGPGRLYRCSDEFVELMAHANRELVTLGDEDKARGDKEFTTSTVRRNELDAAWLAAGKWHRAQVSTVSRLFRIGGARIAQEKSQSLYCWYGPPVQEYVVVSGTGPYPSKQALHEANEDGLRP